MMEVNHNTALEFGDLLTSISNSNDIINTEDNQDNVSDVEMVSHLKTPLSKEDNSKQNETVTNGLLADINGTNLDPTTVDLGVTDLDLEDAQISPELEDKLLADDDTDVVDKLLAEVVPSTVLNSTPKLDDAKYMASAKENTQADNSETLRNPGDDLDTLLSKINDIVDDCIEPGNKNSSDVDLISLDTLVKTKTEDSSNELDESVILLDESAVEEPDNDDSKMREESCKNYLESTTTGTADIATANQENNIEDPKSSNANDGIENEIQENLDESMAVIATEETSTRNLGNLEQTIEPKANEDKECLIPKNINITESDQMILDIDLEDMKDKSASPAKEKPDYVSEIETKDVKGSPTVENVSAEEENTGLKNDDTKSELEVLTKCDDGTPILSENEVTNKPEVAAAEPTTDKKPESTPVISLDADDSDDDIVFFCESSKNSVDAKEIKELESEQNNQADNKTDDERKVEENVAKEELAANNIDDDEDDVVLLDDDDEDDDNLTKPVRESNKAQIDILNPQAKTDETSEQMEKSEIESSTDVQEKAVETKQLSSKEVPSKEDSTKDPSKEDPTKAPSKETDSKILLDDNSDNAKDKFDAAANGKKLDAENTAGGDAEETNSNCSSSSNLLQEAKAVSEEEEAELGNEDEEDVAENESETAGTEVDIVEEEIAEDDSKEGAPPAKRMRLSTDDDGNNKPTEEPEVSDDKKENLEKEKIEKETESGVIGNELEHKINETDIKSDKDKAALKRSIDSLESDEKTDLESVTKKLKTDELPVEEVLEKKEPTQVDNKLDVIEILDGKEDDDEVKSTKSTEETTATIETTDEITEVLPIVKAIPSHVPIPLYPPPQFQESPAELNLDFLKRFKKSLDEMTKIDLEELILQKIVEAIIHKSEFGEMRELIEKQEKIIATHRTKITELSKQFRDLEMVHNRVLKDIEVKNSQFLMPVKITRAVGLQVFIPHKKNIEPAPSTTSTSVGSSSSSTANVLQSPQNQYRSLNNSGSLLTSPSRQNTNDTATSSRLTNTALPSAAAAAAAANARRGCVQKITPQRPVDTSANTSQQISATYRAPQTQQPLLQQNPTKLLNKSVSSAPAQIRNRYSGPSSMVQQQQQQQLARQQPSPTNQVRKISPAPTSTMSKPHNSNAMPQYRRPDSTPQSTNSPATVPENYMSQLPPGMPAVSITPAKPKEKSVIDLTDEDDAPSSAPTAASSTAVRRPPSVPNNSNSGSSNYAMNKLPTNPARMPPNQSSKAQTTARQQLASIMYGGSKPNGSPSASTSVPGVSTPPGTSITRIQLGTRKSYSHPAPLPPTPSQNLNPSWKLPPPRPTIRISNLDNGIVISWTVEESMDRHADCVSYQIYAYQETSGPPLIDSWRHVGDVKAMLLPMAVTLTQFQEGQRYYFAVRAVDVHHRVGPFSLPKTWS